MFGSIATNLTDKSSDKNEAEDRPPINPTNPMDPWNDTSLIQFWQQATQSYKLHHDSASKTPEPRDPLLERKKRAESTIQVDQTPSKKRTKRGKDNRITLTTEQSTTIYSASSSENTINRTNMPLETDEDEGLEHVDDMEQKEESKNMDTNKENEYEYAPEDGEEEYQEYGDEYDYDYDQDPNMENQNYQGNYDYDYTHGYPEQYPQGHQHYQHYQQDYQSAPPPPPPAPPMFGQQGNEAFSNMIMAWYYSGYYTGLYQAQQR